MPPKANWVLFSLFFSSASLILSVWVTCPLKVTERFLVLYFSLLYFLSRLLLFPFLISLLLLFSLFDLLYLFPLCFFIFIEILFHLDPTFPFLSIPFLSLFLFPLRVNGLLVCFRGGAHLASHTWLPTPVRDCWLCTWLLLGLLLVSCLGCSLFYSRLVCWEVILFVLTCCLCVSMGRAFGERSCVLETCWRVFGSDAENWVFGRWQQNQLKNSYRLALSKLFLLRSVLVSRIPSSVFNPFCFNFS